MTNSRRTSCWNQRFVKKEIKFLKKYFIKYTGLKSNIQAIKSIRNPLPSPLNIGTKNPQKYVV